MTTVTRIAKPTAGESAALPPFLKWAGGKRWLAKSLQRLMPEKFGTFIEPFAGSAASFFSLRPAKALLSDANEELINTYQVMRDAPDRLFSALERHQAYHCDDYYYSVRAQEIDDAVSRAARLIYLNRTCWNGLYRVNRKGKFNVPRGTKNSVILSTDDFGAYSRLLGSAEIMTSDFETAISRAVTGDVIFADPPYTVAHNNNGFVKYNENMFSWQDQIRLKDCLVHARNRGVTVIATNAAHSSLIDLYDGVADITTVSRASVLAGDSTFRRATEELLITMGLSDA